MSLVSVLVNANMYSSDRMEIERARAIIPVNLTGNFGRFSIAG